MEASDSLLLHKSATAEVINIKFLLHFSKKLFAYPFFVGSALCKGEREREYYQANPQGRWLAGAETQWKKYLNPSHHPSKLVVLCQWWVLLVHSGHHPRTTQN
jgi:hypothetical protein